MRREVFCTGGAANGIMSQWVNGEGGPRESRGRAACGRVPIEDAFSGGRGRVRRRSPIAHSVDDPLGEAAEEVGVSLHTFGMPPSHLGPLAATADRLGFDVLWISEHLIAPVGSLTPHPRSGNAAAVVPPSLQLLDPWVAIGHISARTQRILLGTSVYVAPLRHPIQTARMIGTAQFLSGGRVLAGLGVGWLEEEFAAVGAPYHVRGAVLDEIIDVLELLWRGGPVAHHGPMFPFGPVDFGPIPPRIPIILGGSSLPALRRAARRADGWILTGKSSLHELLELRRTIDGFRAGFGRVNLPFTYYVSLPEPTREQRERYHDAGFPNVTVNAFAHWRSIGADLDLPARLESIEALASELGVGPPPPAPEPGRAIPGREAATASAETEGTEHT
jgi:probable F420-dependent oxidoreductase